MYDRQRGDGGEPQGDLSCSISAGLFSVCTVLAFPFPSPPSPPEMKMLEGPESHRGVIRVCCSPPSSLPPPLQTSHTEEGRTAGWGLAPNHYDPASCFVHGGLPD